MAKDPFSQCVVDHHRLVNNSALYPDVFYTVDDKHEVQAHNFILRARLSQLLDEGPGLKKKKQKKNGPLYFDLVKDQYVTAEALERVMHYAYSGILNDTQLTPVKAVEVMRASIVYKIPRLLALSSKFLQQSLTMENIFKLLKVSDSMEVNEAKTICIDFALQKPDFFTSANAEDLGFKLYQEVTSLLLKAHQSQGGAKGLMNIEISPEDTIVKDFKAIFNSAETTSDIVFSIKGQEIRAHKAIIANQSQELANLILQFEANKDAKKNNALYLEEKYGRISPKAFEAMLRFFYYNDQNIEMSGACELLPFAKDFKLAKLCSVLEKIIGSNEISYPCLSVLDVAYNPLMGDNKDLQTKLKQEGLDFAVYNIDKIDFKPLEQMHPQIGSHILQRLQQTVGAKWSSLGVANSWAASPTSTTRNPGQISLGSKARTPSSNNMEVDAGEPEKEKETQLTVKKAKSKKKPKEEIEINLPEPPQDEGEENGNSETTKAPKKKKKRDTQKEENGDDEQ